MNLPRMIVFDYGHTLCYEASFDNLRGTDAIMKYAVYNHSGLSNEAIALFSQDLFNGNARIARKADIEVNNILTNHFIYDYLQIGFSLSPEEIEMVFWDNAAKGVPMKNIDNALRYLADNRIRSAVLSNIAFCGNNLKRRINELLPDHTFEFIIATGDYVYRKPNKLIFDLALRKAGLTADEVWFCGDSVAFDLDGAYNAGMYPVWYHSEIDCFYRDKSLDTRPSYDHLYIRDWDELISMLEKTKK